MATSPVNRLVPRVYSGYKVSLHYLLNRIMEQGCTPGRNLGGLLEKGGQFLNAVIDPADPTTAVVL